MIASLYDIESDEIFVISAGGSLFRGYRDGTYWTVVNQDHKFSGSILEFIETPAGRRMIAIIDRIPHYSDDMGLNWTPANGISHNDSWGNVFHPKYGKIDGQDYILMLAKPDYWTSLSAYLSTDQGESYQKIADLGNYRPNQFHICVQHHTDKCFLVDRTNGERTDFYLLDPADASLDLIASTDEVEYGDKRCFMAASYKDSVDYFYIYNKDLEVMRSHSLDSGWTFRGVMDKSPWGVGLYISPSDPDFLLMGEVECYKTHDGGISWEKINGWAEYYQDVPNKLHADMMYFREFTSHLGETFMAISNHGGMSLSYDYLQTTPNIGMNGLNVSQYYDVVTDPRDRDIIYAGTQDQGLQRGREVSSGILPFEQVISGDYGHMSFSKNGERMWVVYPGGWISYYRNPHFDGGPSVGFTIDSDNESVWIPPLCESPYPDEDVIYAAGGNIYGGAGSHLIRLEFNGVEIEAEQFDFDFKAASGGEVSAIEFSNFDPNTIYVATTNGQFYTSRDAGDTWERARMKVPEPQYLYGSSIYASLVDSNTVYIAGSGYSNSPVLISSDGGRIFRPMREGMPNTLVFEITGNEDESMLFAGTENGPYVFISDSARWYPMMGSAAPVQRYWSVEFLPERNVVRFGTYGRGVWDFNIDDITTKVVQNTQLYASVYPNPATVGIQIKGLDSRLKYDVSVSDLNGRVVLKQHIIGADSFIRFNHLSSGVYIIKVQSERAETYTQSIIII